MPKARELLHEHDWKRRAVWVDGTDGGYFRLETADTGDVPVRLFVTDKLLTEAEATGHPVLIPGSNRDHSYVLMPEAGAHKSGFSVNHGAGRRLSRGEAMRQLDQRKVDEQYRRDDILVNLDGRVPLDESSQCYKSAEEVVAAGLARVEHTLWPLASTKGNEEGAARDRRRAHKEKERSRDRDRDASRRTKGHY